VSAAAPYLATVIELYRRPHNQGALAAPTHMHEGVNLLCGDRVRIELEVRDGAVMNVAFVASACAIATASASLLTDGVRGRAVGDALAMDDEAMIQALGAGAENPRRGNRRHGCHDRFDSKGVAGREDAQQLRQLGDHHKTLLAPLADPDPGVGFDH